jgi:RNA polymerase sigma factor (sigma-70 family)
MAEASGPELQDVSSALEKYAHMVRRICFLYLKHREDVEDVFQDVFLQYMERSANFENDDHEKAWLIRVAINSCKDLRRSFWKNRVVPLDEDVAAETGAEPEDHTVLDAILKLPSRERTAVYLYYYEGYSADEIAVIEKQKLNTIYSHLHRARRKLARWVQETEDEETD